MLLLTSSRRCSLRSWSSDGSSGTSEANATWQSSDEGAGVSHSSMHLPPDFLSHSAGHLHAPDGRHDGSRWSHSTRGEVPSNFQTMLFSLLCMCVCVGCVFFFFNPCVNGTFGQQKNASPLSFLSGLHTWRSSQRCESSSERLPQCQQCISFR